MSRQEVYVTPQFINGPKKEGGKHGSIKTAEYKYISVPVSHLHEFQKGVRAFIVMETTPEGYHNFVGFAHEAPRQQPQAHQESYQGYQERPRQPAPQRREAPQARPPAPMHSANPEGRDIFITGVTGRAMGSGKFTSMDILTLTLAAAAAYDQVILGKPKPQFDDDMPPFDDMRPRADNSRIPYTPPEDDEIPFG